MQAQTGSLKAREGSITERVATLSIACTATGSTASVPNSVKPHIFGDEHFDFDFDFAEVEKAWPGPWYDEKSLLAPGTVDKARPTKRRTQTEVFKEKTLT